MSVQQAFFDVESKSRSLESATPQEILAWALEFFGANGKLCMLTSFQLSGMAQVDMLSKLQKDLPVEKRLPVLFIDTGFHFPETLAFRDEVVARYGLNLRNLTPIIDRDLFKAIYGDDQLYYRNPQECCRINKVAPHEIAFKAYSAEISGLRRDQSADRADTPIIRRRVDGFFQVHPLANWTRDQVSQYLKDNNVPIHPLHAKGYKTIGCFPTCCTIPVGEHAPERAGRWTGTGKTECGLHLVGQKQETNDFAI